MLCILRSQTDLNHQIKHLLKLHHFTLLTNVIMIANNNKGTDHHTPISQTECIHPRQKSHHSNISTSLFANRIVYGAVILLLLVAPLGKSILNLICLYM